MDVATVPAQTLVCGSLPAVTDLADLLALCNAMGLEIVSVRRLPSDTGTASGSDGPAGAGEVSAPELSE